MYKLEEKRNKLNDINAIEFGENIQEITTSMEIIMMLFQVDDDKEIIAACKNKLIQGIDLLKKLGQNDISNSFKMNV